MTFDARETEARISLNLIAPAELPPVAWAALEAGHDGPAIRRMAAFDNPTGFETDRFLPEFLREAGMTLLSIDAASRRLAYDRAREILNRREDPLASSEFFSALWIMADYPRSMQELGTMPDDIYVAQYSGLTENDVRRAVRDRLILFVREYESVNGP